MLCQHSYQIHSRCSIGEVYWITARNRGKAANHALGDTGGHSTFADVQYDTSLKATRLRKLTLVLCRSPPLRLHQARALCPVCTRLRKASSGTTAALMMRKLLSVVISSCQARVDQRAAWSKPRLKPMQLLTESTEKRAHHPKSSLLSDRSQMQLVPPTRMPRLPKPSNRQRICKTSSGRSLQMSDGLLTRSVTQRTSRTDGRAMCSASEWVLRLSKWQLKWPRRPNWTRASKA